MKANISFLLFSVVLLFGQAKHCHSQDKPDTMVRLPVPPGLTTPAQDCLYTIPVVIVAYLPSQNGVDIDTEETGVRGTVDEIGNRIDIANAQIKFGLEEGSRYHGYRDKNAKPALGYKILACYLIPEKMPRSSFKIPWNKNICRPDYAQMLERIGGRDWVEEQGVKEFWVWGYHHGDIEPVESNMASPLTGDISNSERVDDLPIFKKTYMLTNFNFGRTAAEGLHNFGHHMEAVMSYAAAKQDGKADLWNKKWLGQDAAGKWVTGRAGWTHMPPNTLKDYEYNNRTLVESDIEDWTPDHTGATRPVNVDTWDSIPYAWPNGIVPGDRAQAQFYIYWRQNIPGWNNNIPYKGGTLTNWWRFIGDWDGAIKEKMGLYKP